VWVCVCVSVCVCVCVCVSRIRKHATPMYVYRDDGMGGLCVYVCGTFCTGTHRYTPLGKY
jgi:hypothetical protein